MTPARAKEVLDASAGRRVLLVGDLMMDEWVFGSVKRISPEAPIPVVTMPLTEDARAYKPGGAGNVAAILLGLGAAVKVVGVVGDDGLGKRLVADLDALGADVSDVIGDPSRPTTHKMRIIAGRQQLLRVDTERAQSLSLDLGAQVHGRISSGLEEVDVVLIADYAKGVLSQTSLPSGVATEARRRAIPFCADPKPVNIELFRGASLVSPNETEALETAGLTNSDMEASSAAPAGQTASSGGAALPLAVQRAGGILLERLEADAVFITRGEKGIAVFCRDGTVGYVEAATESGSVGDGTGCGDAASAAAALALAAGAGHLEAAELANAAGGVVSRFVGVYSPQPSEIIEWLSGPHRGPRG